MMKTTYFPLGQWKLVQFFKLVPKFKKMISVKLKSCRSYIMMKLLEYLNYFELTGKIFNIIICFAMKYI